jgi:hypothetical protein
MKGTNISSRQQKQQEKTIDASVKTEKTPAPKLLDPNQCISTTHLTNITLNQNYLDKQSLGFQHHS